MYSDGGVAQLGEHLPCKQGVKGSNPFISTADQIPRTHLENRIYESIYKKLTGRLKAGREAEDKMRRQKIGKTSEESPRKG